MSLLTDAEKAALSADFAAATATWLRPLRVWQEAQKTVIVSDPNWNPYTANNQNSVDIINTPVCTIISGAILWDKTQDYPFLKPEIAAQIKVKNQVERACRVKVDASGHALLASCKQVEIDGEPMIRDTKPRPHGLFSTDRYTYYFIRSN